MSMVEACTTGQSGVILGSAAAVAPRRPCACIHAQTLRDLCLAACGLRAVGVAEACAHRTIQQRTLPNVASLRARSVAPMHA